MDENHINKGIFEDNIHDNTNDNKNVSKNPKRMLTEEEKKQLANSIKNNENGKAKAMIDNMKDIDQDIFDEESALFIASRNDNFEIVKYLIQLGANVNLHNNYYSYTSLFGSSLENMKLLVDAGANIHHVNKLGHTALSNACSEGLLEEVKYLISVGADVNVDNGFALYMAVGARNNELEICKVLIEAGVNINYVVNYDGNPLHLACKYNNLNLIELLLDNGADEYIKNKSGKIPIECTTNEEIKEFMNNYNSTKFILK